MDEKKKGTAAPTGTQPPERDRERDLDDLIFYDERWLASDR